jgi:hypothetical protein
MPISEVPASLWARDPSRCHHVRQRHPLHDEALLACAWPGCPDGTRNAVIQVPIGDDFGDAAVLLRFERESLPRGPRLAFRWRCSQ